MIALGFPADLWRYAQSGGIPGHPMQRATALYRDIEIAAHFHQWPHDFYQLPKAEQRLLRYWFMLHAYKQAYFAMPQDKRNRWPYSLREI